MNTAELIQREARSLPEPDAQKVLDFVVRLKEKSGQAQWDDLMKAQERSLAGVWNNDEDKVWNDV